MNNKNEKKKKKNLLFIILMLICVAVIAIAAYKLISIHLDYKAGTDEYNRLREYTKTVDTETAEATAASSGGAHSGTSDKDEEYMTPKSNEPSEEETVTSPLLVDHEALKSISSDYVGWLYLGEENISYPIVRGADNSFYLHRSIEGGYLYSGTIFMDCNNSADFSDAHTLLYGHNMKDQSMFGRLKLMSDRGSVEDPYFWILTPEKDYKYRMFSMQVCAYNAPVYNYFKDSSDAFQQYLMQRYAESSIALSMEGALDPPRIITLSTCYGTGETGDRFVVQGILVAEVEHE